MFIKSLLNLHSYRKFDYKPRYYNETKDKINEIREKRGFEPREFKESSKRISFRKHWENSNKLTSPGATSFRISIILFILCLIAYFILRSIKIF